MKILVTGSNGFIGKNLIVELRNRGYKDIYEYDIDKTKQQLSTYVHDCDIVFHLAGVNRPQNESEFMEGNTGFTQTLLEMLGDRKVTIFMSSSIQAALDNPYGRSKHQAENLVFEWAKKTNNKAIVYRLPNVFGKWCRPNYNSVVATFCHNIANCLPIQVNDSAVAMKLVYIDDVVKEFICALNGQANYQETYCGVEPVYTVKLGEIAELVRTFKASREQRSIPNMSDEFTKKLYSTYVSYLPKDQFSYPLNMNADIRGSFTEFIKTPDRGQVSVNISKPGIIKGNHWHHNKNEKFLVVSGRGVIRFRRVDSDEIVEYFVSGDTLEVLDIPTGYAHNIENLGDLDMVTIMWANECFNPEKPDTFSMEV